MFSLHLLSPFVLLISFSPLPVSSSLRQYFQSLYCHRIDLRRIPSENSIVYIFYNFISQSLSLYISNLYKIHTVKPILSGHSKIDNTKVKLIIIFRGMIFSTITLSRMLYLFYYTEYYSLIFSTLLSPNHGAGSSKENKMHICWEWMK